MKNPVLNNHTNPEEEEQVAEDNRRVSRLFYLQLLSSVLNPSAPNSYKKEPDTFTKGHKKPAGDRVVASLSWMDVTNLLSRQSSTATVRSERERDVGDSFHPNEMSFRQMGTFTRSKELYRSSRRIEPILNTRMRELSNFTLTPRDSEQKVIEQKSYQCRTKKVVCSTIYISLTTAAITLLLLFLLNNRDSYSSFYETVYLKDNDPASRPKIGLCLTSPFSLKRLSENNVSFKLASFLLFSLSPYLPNQDILEDQNLLTNLTTQFRNLISRTKRTGGSTHRLKKLLRSLAPKCSEIITSCQIGSRQILQGEDCCKRIFADIEFSLRGLCFIASDFAKMSSELDFPAVIPGSAARLTVFLNASAADEVDLDPKVIGFSARRTPLTLTLGRKDELTHSDMDVSVLKGQTISVVVKKRGVDNAFPGSSIFGCANSAENNKELFGDTLHPQASCRNAAIQMIAEKSVNCSLLSLPRMDKSLPACEPLEGLGLMYVLREQGSLVSTDPKLLSTFEEGVSGQCSGASRCDYQYFEPLAGALMAEGRDKDQSILELQYKTEEFVRVRRFQPGLINLLLRLGSLCGLGLTGLVLAVGAWRWCKKRRNRLMLRRKNKTSYDV